MLIPIRCFTCGTLIADKDVEYQEKIKAGENPKKVLDDLGVKRYCCRRMLMTSVKTVTQIIPFYEATYKRSKEVQAELE